MNTVWKVVRLQYLERQLAATTFCIFSSDKKPNSCIILMLKFAPVFVIQEKIEKNVWEIAFSLYWH